MNMERALQTHVIYYKHVSKDKALFLQSIGRLRKVTIYNNVLVKYELLDSYLTRSNCRHTMHLESCSS